MVESIESYDLSQSYSNIVTMAKKKRWPNIKIVRNICSCILPKQYFTKYANRIQIIHIYMFYVLYFICICLLWISYSSPIFESFMNLNIYDAHSIISNERHLHRVYAWVWSAEWKIFSSILSIHIILCLSFQSRTYFYRYTWVYCWFKASG